MTLVDQFGNDIVDANGDKIWFPATFDPSVAKAFGKSLGRLPASTKSAAMLLSFVRGGPWDLQRSYNGQSNAPFAEVLTRAASYALGLVGAAAGQSQTALMAGGGLHNLRVNPKTAGLNFGNNPKNPPFIAQGFRDYFGSVFAPPGMIPPGTVQGKPALSMPVDRIKTAFDHSFNGMPDNFNRLAASVINGSVVPTAGFSSRATAERRPSYPLPATIATSTPAAPGSWLNSMLRNGEVERIARSEATSPSPMWTVTLAFEPDAVHSPDGYFAGDPSTAFLAIASSTAVPSSRNATSQGREGPFDTRFGSWGSSPANTHGSDKSKASVFDAGAPPIRYLSSKIIPSSANRRNTIGSVSDRFLLIRRVASLAGSPLWLALTPPIQIRGCRRRPRTDSIKTNCPNTGRFVH